MSVTRVTEIWQGRRGVATQALTSQVFGTSIVLPNDVIVYTRMFRVLTSSPLDSHIVVLGAVDPVTKLAVPQMFDGYKDAGAGVGDTAYAVAITPEQDVNDPQTWTVRVEYSTEALRDPTQIPTVIEYDSIPYQKFTHKDQNGKLLKNSAGDYFDPEPTTDDSRFLLRFTKNVFAVNENLVFQYRDAVNSDAWYGRKPRECKVGAFRAAPQFDSVVLYYRTVWEIHVNLDGWDLSILDAGYRHIDPVSGLPVVNIDPANNSALNYAALLDGTGKQLAVNGAPVFLPFRVLTELPFAALKLP